jgi:serine/threonine protein kinase
MSPEIVEGGLNAATNKTVEPYGTKTDMWSFGVILFILLGGDYPFEANSTDKLCSKIQNVEFTFDQYFSRVSDGAKALISSLLTVDPRRRLSAQEALKSGWILTEDEKENSFTEEYLKRLRSFNLRRKWKDANSKIIAMNRVSGLKRVKLYTLYSECYYFNQEDERGKEISGILYKGNSIHPRSSICMKMVTIKCVLKRKSKCLKRKSVILVNKNDIMDDGEFFQYPQESIDIKKIQCANNRKEMTPMDKNDITKEVEILRQLDHDNIIRLHDFFEEENFYYLVMEEVESQQLFDRIVENKCYNEREARNYFKMILAALEHMHNKGIVHRNLKPANLLLSIDKGNNDIVIKIADFGT